MPSRDDGWLLMEHPQMKHSASCGVPSAAHAATAAFAAVSALASAQNCSAPPAFVIVLHRFLWPLDQCRVWHSTEQYLRRRSSEEKKTGFEMMFRGV